MKERSNQTLGMVGIDENLFLNKNRNTQKHASLIPRDTFQIPKHSLKKKGAVH